MGKLAGPLKRYGLAVAFAVAALAIRGALPFPEGTAIYQLPIAAIVLSGWIGGRGPGWLTLAITATGASYWFVPPVNSFETAPEHQLGFWTFVALGIVLTEFGASRRRIERALEESERRFRAMAEAVPQILWFESIEPRRMLYASPRFEEIWQVPLRDLEENPDAWLESIHPEDREEVRNAYAKLLVGEGSGRFDASFRIMPADGSMRFIHSRATLIRDEDGRPHRVSGVAEDVTEDKRAEAMLAEARAELAQASRLTTIGQLAASIAHEVNQPLAAIVANAAACDRWMTAEPPETAKAHNIMKTIVADGQRASAVIGRIRGLLKRQPPQKELIDVNEVVREVLMLARYDLRRGRVAIETSLAEGLPRARGDRVQLQQVLLNLIVNAIQAMDSLDDGPRRLVIASEKDREGAVTVTVRDNGAGFDPAILDRLFDPFYTTKADGMGMGLAISRSTVESHGGRIWATPNEPRGAAFHFTLPPATA